MERYKLCRLDTRPLSIASRNPTLRFNWVISETSRTLQKPRTIDGHEGLQTDKGKQLYNVQRIAMFGRENARYGHGSGVR